MKQWISLTFAVIIVTLPGVQCFGLGGNSTGTQSGLFISTDKGQNWNNSSQIDQDGVQGSLERFDINDITIDSQHNSTLYAATAQAGLYKSNDSGQSWQSVTTSGNIKAINVNRVNNNHLIAARENQVFVSSDRGNIWRLVYTDPTEAQITDVIFDPLAEQIAFMSTSGGELLKSADLGETWSLVRTFDNPIKKVIVHPRFSSEMYVLTTKPDLMRSSDGGINWQPVLESLKKEQTIATIVDVKVHPRANESLFMATERGLFLTNDAGESWQTLPLLTTTDERIQSIGWDPEVVNIIYYATPTVFFASQDSGQSWRTSIFSSRRLPRHLIVDPNNRDKLYIATSN